MKVKKYIDSLTGARFVAIMVIVVSHFEFLKQYSFGQVYWTFFHNATMGVDFFFMLSGFGMMLSSIRRNSEEDEERIGIKYYIHFAISHVKKIYWVYVVTLVLGIPFYVISMTRNGAELSEAIIKTIVNYFLLCLTLMQSATGIVRYCNALNGVAWFLSTLFCIYLVSPIIIKCLRKKVRSYRNALFAVIISIGISYVFAVLFNYIEERTVFDNLCYGSPYRRIFYVICGMLIAQL